MSLTTTLTLPVLVLLVLVLLAVAGMAAQSKGRKGKHRTGAYRRRQLMTENELEFFGRLVVALPEHYIFPQVALSALLEAASGDKQLAHGDWRRIAQHRVDYVVCTRHCEVVAVIELDDRTHSRAKDQLRDARLDQAGIRTVRFQSRGKPRADAIRGMILGAPAAGEGAVCVPASTAGQVLDPETSGRACATTDSTS